MLPVELHRGEDALRNDRPAILPNMFEFSDPVAAQDLRLCEAAPRNAEAGVCQGGVLSPKHEAGVAWFQDRIAGALGLPQLAAVG